MSDIRFPSKAFLDSLARRKTPLQFSFLMSGMDPAKLSHDGTAELAIVGRSNVGKSSLLNFLAGQKQLAFVSNMPGRTQCINLFAVENRSMILADLPGYGFAQSPNEVRANWEKAMELYFKQRSGLVGVLFLMDARREPDTMDQNLCAWFSNLGLRVLGVQTKCDKLSKGELPLVREAQREALRLPPGMMISTSSQKKLGLPALLIGISGLLGSAKE